MPRQEVLPPLKLEHQPIADQKILFLLGASTTSKMQCFKVFATIFVFKLALSFYYHHPFIACKPVRKVSITITMGKKVPARLIKSQKNVESQLVRDVRPSETRHVKNMNYVKQQNMKPTELIPARIWLLKSTQLQIFYTI